MHPPRFRSPVLAGLVVAAATLAGPASAQPCDPEELAKLLADDGAMDDEFGQSVSVWGDVAVIGGAIHRNSGSGWAYVYRFDGTNWAQEAKLVPTETGLSGGPFTVSIWDDTIVIGAPRDGSFLSAPGAAYVFRHDGTNWVQEAKLTASDEFTLYYFGESVSISGDTIIIGAPGADGNLIGDFTGAAYVFRYDGANWAQELKLIACDGVSDDSFGVSVSISGDTAVVGAYNSFSFPDDSGSAYIFRYDGTSWVEEAKLLTSNVAEDDAFGWSVSVSGDTAVIGAPFNDDDDKGNRSGAAYISDLNCIADCLADVNGDGVLNGADFLAWIDAFNNNLPGCDQNGDGACTSADYLAWVANFKAGCP